MRKHFDPYDPSCLGKLYHIYVDTPKEVREIGWARINSVAEYEQHCRWIMDLFHGAMFSIEEVTRAEIEAEAKKFF